LLKPSDQIKFVIASKPDFDWMVDVVKQHSLSTRFQVLVSGVFGAATPVELAEWLLNSNLNLRMQLQIHKYIWSPDARGV
jgi:7-carboxy-7-deazaguanine synthase